MSSFESEKILKAAREVLENNLDSRAGIVENFSLSKSSFYPLFSVKYFGVEYICGDNESYRQALTEYLIRFKSTNSRISPLETVYYANKKNMKK